MIEPCQQKETACAYQATRLVWSVEATKPTFMCAEHARLAEELAVMEGNPIRVEEVSGA